MPRFILPLALVLLALNLPAPAAGLDDQPSTRDIIEALKPAPDRPRMRGISVEPPPPPSIDMRVNFEFNSATLTPDAKDILDRLGQALNSAELAGSRFQVAGHTDAVGGDAFNQALSERRAETVKHYLAERHRVRADRLSSVGYGESRLLDPEHPDSARNRRVQVTNLGQ